MGRSLHKGYPTLPVVVVVVVVVGSGVKAASAGVTMDSITGLTQRSGIASTMAAPATVTVIFSTSFLRLIFSVIDAPTRRIILEYGFDYVK